MSIAYESKGPNVGVTRLVRWLSRYALHRWPLLIGVIVTTMLRSIVEVLKPWPMLVLVDHILNRRPLSPGIQQIVNWLPAGTDAQLLAWTVFSTIALFLLGWVLGVAGAYANIVFSQRMVYDLAGDLFSHLQRLSLRFHARRTIGDSIRRVTSDCACISAIIKDAAIPAASALLTLAVMFVIMWQMDWALTLLSLAVVPMMALTLRAFSAPMIDRSYRQQEIEASFYDVTEQTLSAMPLVQIYRGEERALARFRQTGDHAVAAALSTTSVQLRFNILIGLATALGTAGILWLGGYRMLSGSMTVGGILVFLSYLSSLYAPLEAVMYAPSNVQFASGSARRVLEVLETDQDVRDRPGAITLPRVQGAVAFENVTFGYEPDRPALRSVSIEIPAGQTVAIVGASGAGKSTLASLVPRLFDPWSGHVLLDGTDIRIATLSSLRSQISLVLQEPFLFPLTIAENIAYGRPGATIRQIEDAARAANAHEFIARLPQGYQTVVGERGATLSGGERQRLSIARALLRDTPVLILDEPTSALDAMTEASILGALRRLMAGRTTLMIAHRLSTVREADRIIVLDRGQVAEQGSHQQLLQLDGMYARLHRAFQGRDQHDRSPEVGR